MKTNYVLVGLVALGLGYYLWKKSEKKECSCNQTASSESGSAFLNVAGRPLCTRVNEDGSRTQYSSFGGSKPCPYGGTVV
jgi:hypothetical protein